MDADNISRWVREFDRSDWQFRGDELEALEATTGEHEIDSHADVLGLNALKAVYWHKKKPAELQDWRGRLVWCNGDYADLGPALRRFWECRREDPRGGATFVVPFWPTAPWWRWLKGFKLLRWYPVGTRLFQRPDWTKLALPEGGYGLGSERVWGEGTRWPVLIAHCPGLRRETSGGAGAFVDAGPSDWAGLPELRGEGVHDSGVLRQMPAACVPDVRGPGRDAALRLRAVSQLRGRASHDGSPVAGSAGSLESGGVGVPIILASGVETGGREPTGVHQPHGGTIFPVHGGHATELGGVGTAGQEAAGAGCVHAPGLRIRGGPDACAGGAWAGGEGAQPTQRGRWSGGGSRGRVCDG